MRFLLFFVATLLVIYFTEGMPAKEENPEEICKLPPVRGYCRALLPRWRYDTTVKKCVEFNYGGCGGNANNFMTNEDCMKRCKDVSIQSKN